MTEPKRWRTLIEEADGSLSSTRLAVLIVTCVMSYAICRSLEVQPELSIGLAGILVPAVFALAGANRYQERKETVVENSKPADTNLKVEA